jgi:hypothetical protein
MEFSLPLNKKKTKNVLVITSYLNTNSQTKLKRWSGLFDFPFGLVE